MVITDQKDVRELDQLKTRVIGCPLHYAASRSKVKEKLKKKKIVSKLIKMKTNAICVCDYEIPLCAQCAYRSPSIISQSGKKKLEKYSNRLCAIKNHVLSLYTMYNHRLSDQLMSQPTHRPLHVYVVFLHISSAQYIHIFVCIYIRSLSSSCHGNFAL